MEEFVPLSNGQDSLEAYDKEVVINNPDHHNNSFIFGIPKTPSITADSESNDFLQSIMSDEKAVLPDTTTTDNGKMNNRAVTFGQTRLFPKVQSEDSETVTRSEQEDNKKYSCEDTPMNCEDAPDTPDIRLKDSNEHSDDSQALLEHQNALDSKSEPIACDTTTCTDNPESLIPNTNNNTIKIQSEIKAETDVEVKQIYSIAKQEVKEEPTSQSDGILAPPSKKRRRCSMFVDNLDQNLLDGKKGVDLLRAIEDQSNKHIETHKSSSAESGSSVVSEVVGSPRKGRTRSVDIISNSNQGIKRSHSADADEADIKIRKIDFLEYKDKVKCEYKSSKSKDIHDRRHSSSSSGKKYDSKNSKSSSSRKHSSSSSSRHREIKPRLLTNGNYSYPHEDVSIINNQIQ